MTPPWIARRAYRQLKRVARNDHTVLAILALIIGAGAAGGEILFRLALHGVQYLGFGSATTALASWAAGLPWWHVVAVPTLGGLLIGLFIHLVMGGRAQGVVHVIEANTLHGGRMSARDALGSAAISAASIGVGASTGREGPVVHLGAALGAWVARRLHLSQMLTRTLLGCGVAAAVATAFNAPIAGVFFALEVIIGHYALSAFAPIVLASVTATVISRAHYGDFPAFILPENFSIASVWEFPAFVLLGVVAAAIAIIFMVSMMEAQRRSERTRVPAIVQPAIAGLIVGVMALGVPEILGVGYETTDLALREELSLDLLIVLIVAKIAATSICLGAGFGGGVFSPSLFIGAMTGGAFGIIATMAFPDYSSGHGAYTLVGMGAVAGAVLGAPISTILIVFEMTGDYELTIALMVAVVIASTVTEQTLGRSIFQWQLRRRGVNIRGGRETRLLSEISVGDVMKRDYAAIGPDDNLELLAEKLRAAPYGEVFVLAPDNRLIGVVTQADLAHAEATDSDATAAAIARIDPPMLTSGARLAEAMETMDQAADSHIPVVDDMTTRRVVGFVHEHDVMLAYRRALMQARAEERGDLSPPQARG